MDFGEVVRRRRMIRNFTDQPVDPDVLTRILSAGTRGPSAGNTQATDFLVLRGAECATYWDATLSPARRGAFRWPGLLRAPVLVLPCVAADAYVERYAEADKARAGLGESIDAWPVPYWHVDGGMAALLVLLAAVDEGLGALFFGLFDHEATVRDAFAIPASHQPIGTIAIGHPAPDTPGRSAGRPSRSVEDVTHWGRW